MERSSHRKVIRIIPLIHIFLSYYLHILLTGSQTASDSLSLNEQSDAWDMSEKEIAMASEAKSSMNMMSMVGGIVHLDGGFSNGLYDHLKCPDIGVGMDVMSFAFL